MARRLLTNRLISRDSIKEELRPIEGSKTDYVTCSGKIYSDYGNNMFIQKSVYVNQCNGYSYVNIKYPDGAKSRRYIF